MPPLTSAGMDRGSRGAGCASDALSGCATNGLDIDCTFSPLPVMGRPNGRTGFCSSVPPVPMTIGNTDCQVNATFLSSEYHMMCVTFSGIPPCIPALALDCHGEFGNCGVAVTTNCALSRHEMRTAEPTDNGPAGRRSEPSDTHAGRDSLGAPALTGPKRASEPQLDALRQRGAPRPSRLTHPDMPAGAPSRFHCRLPLPPDSGMGLELHSLALVRQVAPRDPRDSGWVPCGRSTLELLLECP